MKSIFNFKGGDRIITRDPLFVTNEKDPKERRTVEVRVIKQYPDFVLVENRYGNRWCITNAELFQRWYQKQYGNISSSEHGPKFLASGKVA